MPTNIIFNLLIIIISTISFMGLFYIFLYTIPNLIDKIIKGVV